MRHFTPIRISTPVLITLLKVVLLLDLIGYQHISCYVSTGYGGSTMDPSLIVRTNKGLIRGERVRSVTGRLVDQFSNVPYAKPPIGKYRFKHPRPLDPWHHIYNATGTPNSCFQLNDTTFGADFFGTQMWNANSPLSEDCLNLNIWVPYPRAKNVAVMVWIFGGGFYSGTTSLDLYDGKTLSSEERIILVSINYRVGNLGFLYFDAAKHEAPGNAGMFDQLMALRWVHDNIEHFGGNPNNITLFGESAGAVSVAYHLLSPLSQNLFNQAILQSGAPTVPWGITETKKLNHRGFLLAEAVGCPHDSADMENVVECLRSANPMHLMGNETNENFGVVEFAFTPIVDGVFLPDLPENLLENKDFKKTRLLLGSNGEEGTYFIIYHLTEFFKNTEEVYLTREDFLKSVRELTPNMNRMAQDAIVYEYTDWTNVDDPIKNRDAVDKIVGDYHFTCHVNRLAEKYASTGNEVYMYYFTHHSSVNPWPSWMGAIHGYEIHYVFGEPLNPKMGYTQEEILLSRQFMKAWTNFAKSGNPAIDENGIWSQLHWPLYTTFRKEYLTLSLNSTAIGQGPRTKQCAFWHKYLPQFMKEISDLELKKEPCNSAGSLLRSRPGLTLLLTFDSLPYLVIFFIISKLFHGSF